MNILINCSNLRQGGGIQVAQSIVEQLGRFKEHHFLVVLSSSIKLLHSIIGNNIEVFNYDVTSSPRTLLLGRDNYLDQLVNDYRVNAVLTVFGPSRWSPRVPHLCGFARAQLVLTDSPYYKTLSIKERLLYKIWTWAFRKSSMHFYTENGYISNMLPRLLGKNIKVYTVSNYYNQVYDQPEHWGYNFRLPKFDGITSLSVSTHYPHKNFEILIDVARYLMNNHPKFSVRFVLTFDRKEMKVPTDVMDYFVFIGKVDVAECPYLYSQADLMFMPSLVECFTATYPEAMRMEVPIVTTDLEFARGLCGDAACYYSAIDAKSAAEAIYKVATDKEYAKQLVESGKKQLLTYDNYEQRADKLVKILEKIAWK